MQNYKTVGEKATEWDISPRYVQSLCRNGTIAGAIKKAGAWFIPDGAVIKVKTKISNENKFKFVGTKEKIFEQAIELFMLNGFENVSMRNIAKAAGIKQSAIYNHFSSKQEIMDTIYDFFCYYYLVDRLSLEQVEPILQHGNLMDIMNSVWYAFDEEYRYNLSNAIRIIFQRNSTDERAKEITRSLVIDEGIRFVEEVFNRAVEMGRLVPLDTHSMAVFVNSVRIFTLLYWMIDGATGSMLDIDAEEQALYQYATKLLTDLNPPAAIVSQTMKNLD